MSMKPQRRKRLYQIIAILFGLSLSVSLVIYTLGQNINLYFTPSQVVAGAAPANQSFRMGGMVKKSSVQRAAQGLTVSFVVTDFQQEVPVQYQGILPALFREGQGVVIEGKLSGHTVMAEQVLAKHDEKYMPPGIKAANKTKELSHDS